MEARERMGLHSFYSKFQWMYEAYPSEGVGARQIVQWLWEEGQRIKEPRDGAIFRCPSIGPSVALSVVVPGDNALLIGPGKRVISVPLATVARGKFFWAE